MRPRWPTTSWWCSLVLAAFGCSSTHEGVDASTDPPADATPSGDGGMSRDSGPRTAPCIGVRPDPAAWLAEPGPIHPDAGVGEDAGAGCAPANCEGAPEPVWALRDFQPQSCGSQATYGLGVFRGKVTVVALLAAW